MNLKKKCLENSYLYVIIDKTVLKNRSLFNTAAALKKAGVNIIQLRDKNSPKATILNEALQLRRLFFNTKTLFIINDYLDIAKLVNSDGIHLGQGDISIEIARKILDKDKIIGISCHSLKEARLAQDKGADYLSIGPIFFSTTKPEYRPMGLNLLTEVKRKIKIPFFVIGGIDKHNIDKVLSKGIKRVALCSAVCLAKNITSEIKHLSKTLYPE